MRVAEAENVRRLLAAFHTGYNARMTDIDAIIHQSLSGFVADIFASAWYGKEREAISLYVFGHLLHYCRANTILSDPRQLGIEVRVLKPNTLGAKAEVCKDLVIWPEPRQTCW